MIGLSDFTHRLFYFIEKMAKIGLYAVDIETHPIFHMTILK